MQLLNHKQALAQRDRARDTHRRDVDALARARDQIVKMRTANAELEVDDHDAIERHAQRLEDLTRMGHSGPLPALVPSNADVAARITSQRTLAAAERMVENLEGAESESRHDLEDAEGDVTEAAMDILTAEGEALAAEIEADKRALDAKRKRLAGLLRVPGYEPSLVIHRALDNDLYLPITEIRYADELNTPVNQLHSGPKTTDSATAEWNGRLATLLQGDGAMTVTAAAAAA